MDKAKGMELIMTKFKKHITKALTILLVSSCITCLPACSGNGNTTTADQSELPVETSSIEQTEREDSEASESETKVPETNIETEEKGETDTEEAEEALSSNESNALEEESVNNLDDKSPEEIEDVYIGSKDIEERGEGNEPSATTYTFTVRTTDYNTYMESFENYLAEIGGYIAKKDTSFYSIDDKQVSLLARVPRDTSEDFANYIETSGMIDKADHSTALVRDMMSSINNHVKALQQEQTNLLEMAVKTEDTTTVLSIQSRIADITYEINAYNSKLHILDEDSQYDSVFIELSEDKEIAFLPRLNSFFKKMIRGIGNVFVNAAIVVLAVLPIIAILGILIFGIKIAKMRNQLNETKKVADYAKRIMGSVVSIEEQIDGKAEETLYAKEEIIDGSTEEADIIESSNREIEKEQTEEDLANRNAAVSRNENADIADTLNAAMEELENLENDI